MQFLKYASQVLFLAFLAACGPTVAPSSSPGNFAIGLEAATATEVAPIVGNGVKGIFHLQD